MPSYGSLHSPSLKMESRQYGRKGIHMGNIIGDPFALATISIAAVSCVGVGHLGSANSRSLLGSSPLFPPSLPMSKRKLLMSSSLSLHTGR